MSEVIVPVKVLEGLEFIRETGSVNMFDIKGVKQAATMAGYPEVSIWIEKNKEEYSQGISRGFVAES